MYCYFTFIKYFFYLYSYKENDFHQFNFNIVIILSNIFVVLADFFLYLVLLIYLKNIYF